MARILLAEDDNATRDFMSRSLSGEGHEVVTSQDGLEALEHVKKDGQNFDVLITDVEMPGLDGIELAKQAIATHAKLKVLLVSGFESGLGRAAGIIGDNVIALSKPVTLEVIRNEVKTLLGYRCG